MQNIKLTLQYDGTRYLGWKRPEKDHNDRTVSYKIENVLEKVTGTPVTLFSGVRTEPGVHARNLTVNFLTESQLTPAEFKTVLNQYLPQDIAVLDAVSTPERFRADLNAREITYEYAMDLSPIYDLFHKNYRGRLTDLLSDSLFDLPPEQQQNFQIFFLWKPLPTHYLESMILNISLRFEKRKDRKRNKNNYFCHRRVYALYSYDSQ